MSDKLTHLLPCPFCGCTKVPKRQGNGIGDYWLECFDCGASTRLREDGAGMEKDWNRRASSAPAITMPPLNDAMRAVLTNENCIYGTPEELYAALVEAAPAISESEDTERLDFMIEQQAWIQWTVRDGLIRQCQVYVQDEDENYYILSGDERYFNTPRAAIDAARKGEKS
ncbi:Lar family restriction alleviation protein [Burkholderia gladioli]|uniref:Lar family restriction alleviation protein n=1 Tax=Burkholderia gladioli TaxID=28095 RepID=UPI0016420CA3|nr:Lar family restriction alleviation protein [Burkholderia gladioli]